MLNPLLFSDLGWTEHLLPILSIMYGLCCSPDGFPIENYVCMYTLYLSHLLLNHIVYQDCVKKPKIINYIHI